MNFYNFGKGSLSQLPCAQSAESASDSIPTKLQSGRVQNPTLRLRWYNERPGKAHGPTLRAASCVECFSSTKGP